MGQTARPEGGGERDEQLRGGGERDEREGERGERNEREGAGSEEDGTNVRGDEEPTERTTVGGRQEDGRDRRLPDGGSCFGNGSRRASFFVFSDDDIVLSCIVDSSTPCLNTTPNYIKRVCTHVGDIYEVQMEPYVPTNIAHTQGHAKHFTCISRRNERP